MRVWLAALIVACVALGAAAAELTFPPLTGRVVDEAHVLSPQIERRISAKLAAHEKATGQQVVVATVSSLQGQEIEDYGYQLGRAWGIGEKDKNTGAILLVAPTERRVRIEVGYGLEGTLTDVISRDIIENTILPQFRAGNTELGIDYGVNFILGVLRGDNYMMKSQPRDQQPLQQPRVHQRDPSGNAYLILFGVTFLAIFLFSAREAYREGGILGVFLMIFTNILSAIFSGIVGSGGRRSGGDGDSYRGGGGSFGGGGASGRW